MKDIDSKKEDRRRYVFVPRACRKATRAYMRKRGISFTESYSNDNHAFVIDMRYRPQLWKVGCCEWEERSKQ